MSNHYSHTLVIKCSDDRYQNGRDYAEKFESFLESKNAKDRFDLSMFGGSLAFTLENMAELKSYTVKIAKRLGINRVIIIDHTDCGAYNAVYNDDSREKHLDNLAIAKKFFNQEMPDATCETYLQEGNDDYSKIG